MSEERKITIMEYVRLHADFYATYPGALSGVRRDYPELEEYLEMQPRWFVKWLTLDSDGWLN
jgi:hypothetical protein